MKLLLLSLLATGTLLAQSPPPPALDFLSDVKITAKTIATKRSESNDWETDYGSYQKNVEQTKSVEIKLRNRTDKAGVAVIEMIWLFRDAERRGGPAEIGGVSRMEVPLKAREETAVVVSQSASREDDKYAALGIRMQSGEILAGWVARVIDTEALKVVDLAASMEPFKAISAKVPVVKELPAVEPPAKAAEEE